MGECPPYPRPPARCPWPASRRGARSASASEDGRSRPCRPTSQVSGVRAAEGATGRRPAEGCSGGWSAQRIYGGMHDAPWGGARDPGRSRAARSAAPACRAGPQGSAGRPIAMSRRRPDRPSGRTALVQPVQPLSGRALRGARKTARRRPANRTACATVSGPVRCAPRPRETGSSRCGSRPWGCPHPPHEWVSQRNLGDHHASAVAAAPALLVSGRRFPR